MSRRYDLVVIYHPGSSEEERERVRAKVEQTVLGNGAVLETEALGRKRLCHPIKKQADGFYVCYHFETDPALVGDLDRLLQLESAVLRHMLLKKA